MAEKAEKIVCLDGYTLNPGDISWKPFENLGELVVYDRTPTERVLERSRGASYLLTNKTPLPEPIQEQLPDLTYIGVLATGYNIVDVAAAARRSIVVSNVPTYGTDSVSQHVLALLMELVRPITLHHQAVQNGEWSTSPDWCFTRAPITSLSGMTLGIVGLGRIGLAVARIGAALGMRLVGHDAFWPDTDKLAGLAIESLSLDDLFSQADVISLHCPLTEQTHHMVDQARLTTMKPNALIINTSRGPLIDNQALAQALHSGTIAGAGLDVLDVEPPPADHPLIGAPRCIITPHIAWYARSSRERLMQVAAENLQAFIAGAPINQVNADK